MAAHRYWRVSFDSQQLSECELRDSYGGSNIATDPDYISPEDAKIFITDPGQIKTLDYFQYDFTAEDKRDIVEYKISLSGSALTGVIILKYSDDGVNWVTTHDSTGNITKTFYRVETIPILSPAYFTPYLSGGTDNNLESLSRGSTASNTEIFSQTVSSVTGMEGVTLVKGIGNDPGAGTLSFIYSSQELFWTPNGGSAGVGVYVAAGEEFTLYDSTETQMLIVDVNWEDTPIGDTTITDVVFINKVNETFDDVYTIEGRDGDTEYRCYYFKNDHLYHRADNIKLWVEQQPSSSEIFISLDTVQAIRDSVTLTADEGTVPDDTNFVNPDSIGHVNVLTISGTSLLPGEVFPLWVKRVVPPLSTAVTPDINSIGINYDQGPLDTPWIG